MQEMTTEQKIMERIHQLSSDDQQKVLDYVLGIKAEPKGVSGKSLLRFVGTIPADDLVKMAQIIEEDCERIDWSEW